MFFFYPARFQNMGFPDKKLCAIVLQSHVKRLPFLVNLCAMMEEEKNCGWLIMYVIILLNVYDSIYFRVIFPHFNCENIFNYLRLIYNRRSIS